jgi:uncharacterized protein (TIGR03086 family)
VLARVTPDQLVLDSPCAAWKVRDLVNHLVNGTHYFATVAQTGGPPGPDRPDHTAGDYAAAYREGAARAVAAFRTDGVLDREVRLAFGEMPASVFVMIAATDTLTHGWDVAKATGQSTDLDPALAAELLDFAHEHLADAYRGPEGTAAFGPDVDVGAAASAADRLAGFLGRHP